MDRFLNLELMKTPFNWIIIPVICLFALLLLHIVNPESA